MVFMLTRKRLFTAVLWCMAVLAFVQPPYARTAEAAEEKDEPEVTAAAMTINYTLKNGKVGTYYSDYITVSGGTAPYKWTYSGTPPPGLTGIFNKSSSSKLTVCGTPTRAGTYSFKVTATDTYGKSASKYLTVRISYEYPYSSRKESSDVMVLPHIPEVFITSLSVASDDILEAGEGRDSDIISVKAGEPVSFRIGTWVRPDGTFAAVDEPVVFVDDEPLENITVAEDGTFELPAEMVSDDFKVYVKGAAGSEELETETLYMLAEE